MIKETSNDVAIDVQTLTKVYSSGLLRRNRLRALDQVSLQVRKGVIFGLLGPNGAGKTTLLKILLGVIRKTSGNATMLGLPAGNRMGRARVGYLPEQLRMPSHLTGYTALNLYGQMSNVPVSVIKRRRDELLELVGLTDRASDRISKYSKGMRQRLGLVQALLHEPELLVLDEPTDGLDPRARADVRQVITELSKKGVTVFLNSHILQEVEMICDNVAILDRGVVQYSGPVDQLEKFVHNHLGQSTTKMVVDLILAASGEQITAALGETKPIQMQENGRGLWEVRIEVDAQERIDTVIDQLRKNSISIVGITRERVSLEDAFLQLLDHPQAAESQVANV